jgi:hypothetical protein
LFKVAAESNEWQKRVRASTRANQAAGKSALYVKFWSRFLERVRAEHPDWTRAKAPPAQNWIEMPAPITHQASRRRRGRVTDYRDGDVTERERWDEFIDWFVDAGIRLRRAINGATLP